MFLALVESPSVVLKNPCKKGKKTYQLIKLKFRLIKLKFELTKLKFRLGKLKFQTYFFFFSVWPQYSSVLT